MCSMSARRWIRGYNRGVGHDRITRLRIRGLRTLEDIDLEISPVTVLIGDNGSGKSTILEACEILRRTTQLSFWDDLYAIHGGPERLCRQGATDLELGARIEGDTGPPLEYSLRLLRVNQALQAAGERITKRDNEIVADWEHDEVATTYGASSRGNPPILRQPLKDDDPSILRVRAAFGGIRVHVPFDTTPSWIAAARQRRSPMRAAEVLRPTSGLEPLGENIANAYNALKNDFTPAHWQDTLGYVRLGLGDTVESVDLATDPGGHGVSLKLKMRGLDGHIHASALADGMLAYLALVAAFRLGERHSLLAFDEPDLHLHPGLIVRVVQMMEALGEQTPVLLATQSDRLLDALSDPVASVRVLDLEEPLRTRIRNLDARALGRWLEDYRGVGAIRAEGDLRSIIKEEDGLAETDHPL